MSFGKFLVAAVAAFGIWGYSSPSSAQVAVGNYGVFSGGYAYYGQTYSPSRYYANYRFRSSDQHFSPEARSTGGLPYYNRDRYGRSARHYLTRYNPNSGYNGGGQGTFSYGH